MSASEINEKVRRFEDQENARARHALEEHDQKSARKLAMLKERHIQSVRPMTKRLYFMFFEDERIGRDAK